MIANFSSSQKDSYGQQYQLLETSINAILSCNIESIESEELEDKFFLSKVDFELTTQDSDVNITNFLSHLLSPERNYLIRAPPFSLSS